MFILLSGLKYIDGGENNLSKRKKKSISKVLNAKQNKDDDGLRIFRKMKRKATTSEIFDQHFHTNTICYCFNIFVCLLYVLYQFLFSFDYNQIDYIHSKIVNLI